MVAGPPEDGDSSPLIACVGAVVHDPSGRLLLIRRGHAPHTGRWTLPGGRVEPGETPEQAIEREVLEETGLTVRAGAVIGRVVLAGEGVRYDVVDLVCTLAGPPVPVAGDDATDAVFADAATLARLPCTPRLVDTLHGWGVLPR
jgi:8-oxo-dGTP diphosphatase